MNTIPSGSPPMDIPPDENPQLFRMEDFSPQMMPLPWDMYGIMTNPFNNPVPVAPPASPSPTVPVAPQLKKIAPKPAAPYMEHDHVRNTFRENVANGLRMVAEEQSEETIVALWNEEMAGNSAPNVPAIEPSPSCDVNFEPDTFFMSETLTFPTQGRSKLQVFGGKGFDSFRKMCDEDGLSWQDRVAEHAKLVAKEIEIELLRVHKAVDQKYRAKARSIMFNISNRSNPELRARVFAGVITAERLCSMTVEQMAPKELSQWRLAKAEERAQKVLITDEDVNPGKIVKKTHKGEIIMEVDDNDADISAPRLKSDNDFREKSQSQSPPQVVEDQATTTEDEEQQHGVDTRGFSGMMQESSEQHINDEAPTSTENMTTQNDENTQKPQDELPPPGEETPLIDVTDFKGLPEIMSMDGFLKSIGREGSPQGSGDEEMNDVGSDSDGSQDTKGHGKKESCEEGVETIRKVEEAEVKRTASPGGSSSSSPKKRKEPEQQQQTAELWTGSLQLTGTRSTAVHAVFRSGQDVSLSSWPKSIEIKGRVKLGPLAKFLKDLSMSKSRTVTVVSFYQSDSSSSSTSYLKEVTDQYTKGERVGYVEPASGFELYLFPPGKSTWKFLSENGRLKREEIGALQKNEEALVGCIVWRKNNGGSSSGPSDQKKSSHHHSNKKSKTNPSTTSSKSSKSSNKQQQQKVSFAPVISSSLPVPSSSSVLSASLPAVASALTELLLPQHQHQQQQQQQISHQQSLVVKHSNEWQHDPHHHHHLHHLPQHYHQATQMLQQQQSYGGNVRLPQALAGLQPGSRLPGFEGPPGFWKSQDEDLPEFDFEGFLRAATAAVAAAASRTTRTSPPPMVSPLPGAAYHGQGPMVKHAQGVPFQGGGFSSGFQTSEAPPPAMYIGGHHQQQHQFGGGFEQQQQQQHFPPLPPGPRPPGAAKSGGAANSVANSGVNNNNFQQQAAQWMHPNQQQQHHPPPPPQQKSLYHKKATSASTNTQRRYRH